MPSLIRRSEISTDRAKTVISIPIAAMIVSDVPTGARKPFQDENSKPGWMRCNAKVAPSPVKSLALDFGADRLPLDHFPVHRVYRHASPRTGPRNFRRT